eukprot:UN01173
MFLSFEILFICSSLDRFIRILSFMYYTMLSIFTFFVLLFSLSEDLSRTLLFTNVKLGDISNPELTTVPLLIRCLLLFVFYFSLI